jgi:DNA polymerase I-like protein with 3'-5' exonuclease and polymerase domains
MGQAIIDLFDKKVPYVKQMEGKCSAVAARRGYVRTVLGRRCRFPKTRFGYDFTYRGLNRLIQGSSADQTKLAIAQGHEAGYPLQLQVHDELDLTVESMAETEGLAAIMRDGVPCNVPHVVDIETGPSWGEIS